MPVAKTRRGGNAASDEPLAHVLAGHEVKIDMRMNPLAMGGVVGNDGHAREIDPPLRLQRRHDSGWGGIRAHDKLRAVGAQERRQAGSAEAVEISLRERIHGDCTGDPIEPAVEPGEPPDTHEIERGEQAVIMVTDTGLEIVINLDVAARRGLAQFLC